MRSRLDGDDPPSEAEVREVIERRDALREAREAVARPGDGPTIEHRVNGGATVFGTGRDDVMRTLEGHVQARRLPEHSAEKIERLVSSGPSEARSLASRWAVATGSSEYLGAFAKVARDPNRGHMLWSEAERAAWAAADDVRRDLASRAALTVTGGAALVPLVLDPSIILTSDGSVDPLRRISRVVQTVTNDWQGVTSAGVSAEWHTEAAQVADATPAVADAPIPTYVGDAYCQFSFEVERAAGANGEDLAEQLVEVLADAAGQLRSTAYVTGSGVGEPTGVVTKLAATAGSIVTPLSGEAIDAGSVVRVQNALPARWQARAEWIGHLATINAIDALETTNGAKRFPELADGRLLRKPVSECSGMDGAINAAATENNYALVYGDFSNGFVIVDAIGSTVEFIPQVFGANGRPTMERGALLYFSTGSDVVIPGAFRMLNVATVA
jgi:HK97 family phage major capsid protein